MRKKIQLPHTSVPKIEQIIKEYYLSSDPISREITSRELSNETKERGIYPLDIQAISGTASFLYNLGILEKGKREFTYYLTEFGMQFGKAICENNKPQIPKYWAQAARNSGFIVDLYKLIETHKHVNEESLRKEILRRAEIITDKKNAERRAQTIIKILRKALMISDVKIDKKILYEINTQEHKLPFISVERIQELHNLKKKSKFDLSKLIELCNEINFNYYNEYYYAVGMLIRAIIDHIPPIFSQRTFEEVIAYHGNQSFKENARILDKQIRKISDRYLHEPISSHEDLANQQQVNVIPNLDSLLGDVIKKLKQ